ncbi:MAG: hypothetical protein OEZ33_07125 [Gammaproteobacteria bacterium]|nr:hypothetical protein [Gammaproteobacteria bacterium]
MMKIVFYSVCMTLLLSACSDSSFKKEFVRHPVAVVIQQNAAWDSYTKTDETKAQCEKFVLTTQDVKAFFMEAREESQRDYAQSQVMSRCFAEGELTLPRKFKARWRIDQSRRGILMVENNQSYFFYCDSCGSRKFFERR